MILCPPGEYHRKQHTNHLHHKNGRSHLPTHLQCMTPILSRPTKIIFRARLVVAIKMLELECSWGACDQWLNWRNLVRSRIFEELCDTFTSRHIHYTFIAKEHTWCCKAQTLGKIAAKFDPIRAHKCKDSSAFHNNPILALTQIKKLLQEI